jgi:hypothetical protein
MEHSSAISDRESSLRWLLQNRRPEVSRDQALRTLRIALAGDRMALRLLDQMAAENDVNVCDE